MCYIQVFPSIPLHVLHVGSEHTDLCRHDLLVVTKDKYGKVRKMSNLKFGCKPLSCSYFLEMSAA